MSDLPIYPAPGISRRRATQASLAFAWQNASVGLAAFLTVAALALADGGYFPSAWGWTSLGFLWAAAVALLVRSRHSLGVLEGALLAGLAALEGWIALSLTWSTSFAQTVLETERLLVYLSGALALLLIARSRSVRALLAGVLAAIAVVSAYSLATRLFPERFDTYNAIAGDRLHEPLGYWNALGTFAALGTLLALGFAARGRSAHSRALAAAGLVVLLPTLYFTFSRGAWIALGLGVIAAIALDPRRLQLITTLLAVAPWPAAAVTLAYRSNALTHEDALLAAATREGHRLALAVVVLGVASAVSILFLTALERRAQVPRRVRLVYGSTLALLVAGALIAVFIRFGSPPTLVAKTYDAFTAPPPTIYDGNLNKRLFSFSGSGRSLQWELAWENYGAHPWLGSGPGSYERYWMQHRPIIGKVRDAHNLYLETLTELGPFGLTLLVVALGVPLIAAIRARGHPLVPAALGAYVAYLVHAGVDWDWEMTVVTLTALVCGAAMVVAARKPDAKPMSLPFRAAALVGTFALAAFSFVGLVGNSALAASDEAAEQADWATAASQARKAASWMPWSPAPWEQLADVQAETGDLTAARTSLERAIAKDERDWDLWLDLAQASRGRERDRALTRATELNPLSPLIAGFRAETRLQASTDGD